MSVTVKRMGTKLIVRDPVRKRMAELRAALPLAARAAVEELLQQQELLKRRKGDG